MSKPAIVLGAGGHARVLIDALRLNGIEIIGATDAFPEKISQDKFPVPLLGKDDVVYNYNPKKVQLVNGLGTIRVDARRANIFNHFKKKEYEFAVVIHPTATVARDVKIGEGAQLMAGSIVQTGCSLGPNVIINTGVSIDHDCVIGAHSHLAPRVVLSGNVVVGEECHLGTGAVVVHGVHIVNNSFIKAASLVTQKIVANTKQPH